MNFLLILLISLFSSAAMVPHNNIITTKRKCTSTKIHTVRSSGKHVVAYVTATTTLTQAGGTFTSTVYDRPVTVTLTRPESFATSVITITKKIITGKVIQLSTVTVTKTDVTATYVSTIQSLIASTTKTILLETSDSQKSFKIWTGLQVTLLLIGSFTFFI